jgi:hypothetical protein
MHRYRIVPYCSCVHNPKIYSWLVILEDLRNQMNWYTYCFSCLLYICQFIRVKYYDLCSF